MKYTHFKGTIHRVLTHVTTATTVKILWAFSPSWEVPSCPFAVTFPASGPLVPRYLTSFVNSPGFEHSPGFWPCSAALLILGSYIKGIIQYVLFYSWPLFDMMLLKLISIVTCINILIFFIAEWYSFVWIYHSLSIHLVVDVWVVFCF